MNQEDWMNEILRLVPDAKVNNVQRLARALAVDLKADMNNVFYVDRMHLERIHGVGRICTSIFVQYCTALDKSSRTNQPSPQQAIADELRRRISDVRPDVRLGDDESVHLSERQLGYIEGLNAALTLLEERPVQG